MQLALTAGRSRVPRRTSQLLHHEDPRRHPRADASGPSLSQRPDRRQPQDPQRTRSGGTELAGRMGRQGLDAHPAPDLVRRDAIGVCARAAELQYQDGRPGDRRIRIAGDQGALPAADGQPRHLVVPGLLRARGRLGPRVAAHHRGPRRRQLRRQRPEDVDDAGPVRGLDLLPGAHRPAGTQAPGRDLVSALRHEDAGHHPAADQDDRRRPRDQRVVLLRRSRARQSACRTRESGLDVREIPAGQRAHRHRRGGPDQSAPRRGEKARRAKPGCSTIRCSRPGWPRPKTSCWHWNSRRHGWSQIPRTAQPNPASSVLKLRGSQLQQIATELLVEVAGPDALPADGDDISSPNWAQTSAPHYLNYRKTSIYGGSSEVQRNIIASTILGL